MVKRSTVVSSFLVAVAWVGCSSKSQHLDAAIVEASAESGLPYDAVYRADFGNDGRMSTCLGVCDAADDSVGGSDGGAGDLPVACNGGVDGQATLDVADAGLGVDAGGMCTQIDARSSACDGALLACVRAAFQSAIDAVSEADGKYCSEIVHANRNASPSPTGFGIAIIDSGAYISSLTIYRDRVLGHYAPVGDHYEAFDPEIALPGPMARLMGETLAANPEYASSVDTADLARQLRRKYNLVLSYEYYGTHGDWVFNPLAELNPSAYFLLFHEDKDDSDEFQRLACAVREPDGPSKVHAFWRGRGQSIARIIGDARVRGADIRFVNLSAGLMPDDTPRLTQRLCPTMQFTTDELTEIQRAYAEYIEQIAAADVVLVQASLLDASAAITDGNWQQWYSDCEPIPNRVRVGYAVGAKGAQAVGRIDDHTRSGLRCIDLLIGLGYSDLETATERAVWTSTLGTGHAQSPMIFGTSMAAPFGLSVIAHYWQNGHRQDDSRALAAAFRSDASGLPAIRDIVEDHLFLNVRDDYVNNLQARGAGADASGPVPLSRGGEVVAPGEGGESTLGSGQRWLPASRRLDLTRR
jgi:hypothetical protein